VPNSASPEVGADFSWLQSLEIPRKGIGIGDVTKAADQRSFMRGAPALGRAYRADRDRRARRGCEIFRFATPWNRSKPRINLGNVVAGTAEPPGSSQPRSGADRARREAPQFPQLPWSRKARSAPVSAPPTEAPGLWPSPPEKLATPASTSGALECNRQLRHPRSDCRPHRHGSSIGTSKLAPNSLYLNFLSLLHWATEEQISFGFAPKFLAA
jgi:hypothetical protein